MTAETFEYAIKKDVRNNPIVREVDRERHREMWRSTLIGVFLVLVLLFSAWQHFELIRHGYRLEQMQRERTSEEAINRHLRLEIETWDALDRMLTPQSAGTRNWRASMAQDVIKGRPTEIDYMNGHVVAEGRARGVPTPVSAAVVETIHEIQRGERKPAAENIALTLKRAG